MSQKFLLQCTVALACLIPISAGFYGMISGGGDINEDSHLRYLCGLLFGIGLGFLSTIRKIETHQARFRLLTLIVFSGGMGRLYGSLTHGLPGPLMEFGLVMELIITPLLCLWQSHIAKKWGE